LITEDCNLTQLITVPTRITDSSETTIDLLFSSDPCHFSKTGAMACTGSDHLMIYGERKEKISVLPQITTVRSFKKCNKEVLLSDLENTPWHLMEMFTTVYEKWEYWKSLFLNVVSDHAPLVKVRLRKESVEWIDENIYKLMRTRNYYRTKHRNKAKENSSRGRLGGIQESKK